MTEGPVTKDSWDTLPPPEQQERLSYNAVFTSEDGVLLKKGLKPLEMEDKWFVYFVDGWIYLHRSWTGVLIYWLKLDESSDEISISEAWVNRDLEQYKETDNNYDALMLDFLIRCLLLNQNVEFPVRPADIENSPEGVYQHHIVGRAYPEREVPGD